MKIKEVEERVGLSRSNIRFYEREGLLLVDRDQENNYRDYSEEDVERIIKIKTLRMLGVPTADIRRLFADEVTFDDVIKDCMNRIREQERELKEIHKVCENMMQKQLDIHTWDGQIEVESRGIWKARLDEIFAQDMIHESIAQKTMNKNIAIMLLCGYAINIVFTTILWPLFQKYQGYAGNGVPGRYENLRIGEYDPYARSVHWNYLYMIFVGIFLLVFVCRGIVFFTDNVKLQLIIFVVNSLTLSPVLLTIVQWYEDMLILWNHMKVLNFQAFSISGVWLFWILIMMFVVTVYIIYSKWEKLFSKKRYILGLAGIVTVLYSLIYDFIYCYFFGPLICFAIMLTYISISWVRVNTEQEKYSRYDTFTTANFIINPLGFFVQF